MEFNETTNKVIICDHCKHINPIGTSLCKKCGYFIVSSEPVDIEEAFKIQREETDKKEEKIKKEYQNDRKKQKLILSIFLPIIVVWAILMGIFWGITSAAPDKMYETVTIDYENYSETLSVGDDAKIEIVAGYCLAREYKTVNDSYAGEESVYILVITSVGKTGIIKVDSNEGLDNIGNIYSHFTYEKPVTYYGQIVEAPEEALLKYEKDNSNWNEKYGDLGDLDDILRKNNILYVDFTPDTERKVPIEKDGISADKIFTVLKYLFPFMFILCMLVFYSLVPRKKHLEK